MPACRSGLAVLFVLCLWTASCSKSSGSSIVASGTIGPAGGSITVAEGSLAGTVLEIPAGALGQDTDINLANGLHSNVPGALQVGPPAQVQPDKLELQTGAMLTLPFDASAIPVGTPDSEMRAGYRDGAGRVSFVGLTSIDRNTGIATLEIEAFGTWWIAVPDAFVVAAYLPLGDGDRYMFDGNLILTIAHTSNEPNLSGRPLIKLTFTQPSRTDGYYVDNSERGLELLGRFFLPQSQEVLDSPALLLADRALIGATRSSTYTFLGYLPFGSPFVDYGGIAITDTLPEQRTSTSVPAGNFNDCVVVSFDTQFRLTPPLDGSESLRLWLARDVGPVQVQFGASSTFRLRSAVVGGQPVGSS